MNLDFCIVHDMLGGRTLTEKRWQLICGKKSESLL